jgi:hypothetical protein
MSRQSDHAGNKAAPLPPKTVPDFAQRYPRLLARIVAAGNLSCIDEAAVILRDAMALRKNYSDWVLTEFRADARQAIWNVLLGPRHRKQVKPPGLDANEKR